MKRVLSIQDLSCVGRCSLTVALPVLSAMGHCCSVLPTGVLSTHTGFPGPHVRSLTAELAPIARHWQSQGITFDGICVGYLTDPQQARQVEALLEGFSGCLVVDPAMADHGRLYSGLGPDHVRAMQDLCRKGDYLLPNLTEAALLTGLPYDPAPDQETIRTLLTKLLELGPKGAVLTGVSGGSGKIGFAAMGRDGALRLYQTACIPRQFHGTGDLFAAVFTGGLLAGRDFFRSAELAADFVRQCIAETKEATPFGVAFESQLPWLWNHL